MSLSVICCGVGWDEVLLTCERAAGRFRSEKDSSSTLAGEFASGTVISKRLSTSEVACKRSHFDGVKIDTVNVLVLSALRCQTKLCCRYSFARAHEVLQWDQGVFSLGRTVSTAAFSKLPKPTVDRLRGWR